MQGPLALPHSRILRKKKERVQHCTSKPADAGVAATKQELMAASPTSIRPGRVSAGGYAHFNHAALRSGCQTQTSARSRPLWFAGGRRPHLHFQPWALGLL